MTDEGKITLEENDSYKYQYLVKDHLGNTCLVVNKDGTAEADSESDNYSFGMRFTFY